jgi:hypothetical protein
MSASPVVDTSPTFSKRIPARSLLTTRLWCTQKPFTWLGGVLAELVAPEAVAVIIMDVGVLISTSLIAFKPEAVKPRKFGSCVDNELLQRFGRMVEELARELHFMNKGVRAHLAWRRGRPHPTRA